MNDYRRIDHQIRGKDVLPRATAEQLLRTVTTIGDTVVDLAERRRALLVELCDVVQADCGFWSWGRGWPESKAMSPVAIIDYGFTELQRGIVIEWGLSSDTDRTFRQPIIARMGSDRRSTNYRQEIVPEEVWVTFPYMRQQLGRANSDFRSRSCNRKIGHVCWK